MTNLPPTSEMLRESNRILLQRCRDLEAERDRLREAIKRFIAHEYPSGVDHPADSEAHRLLLSAQEEER